MGLSFKDKTTTCGELVKVLRDDEIFSQNEITFFCKRRGCENQLKSNFNVMETLRQLKDSPFLSGDQRSFLENRKVAGSCKSCVDGSYSLRQKELLFGSICSKTPWDLIDKHQLDDAFEDLCKDFDASGIKQENYENFILNKAKYKLGKELSELNPKGSGFYSLIFDGKVRLGKGGVFS